MKYIGLLLFFMLSFSCKNSSGDSDCIKFNPKASVTLNARCVNIKIEYSRKGKAEGACYDGETLRTQENIKKGLVDDPDPKRCDALKKQARRDCDDLPPDPLAWQAVSGTTIYKGKKPISKNGQPVSANDSPFCEDSNPCVRLASAGYVYKYLQCIFNVKKPCVKVKSAEGNYSLSSDYRCDNIVYESYLKSGCANTDHTVSLNFREDIQTWKKQVKENCQSVMERAQKECETLSDDPSAIRPLRDSPVLDDTGKLVSINGYPVCKFTKPQP